MKLTFPYFSSNVPKTTVPLHWAPGFTGRELYPFESNGLTRSVILR